MVKICKLQERTGSYPLPPSLIAYIVRYHFVGIEGDHCGSMGGGGDAIASELVELRPVAIVTPGTPATFATKRATTTIPIAQLKERRDD